MMADGKIFKTGTVSEWMDCGNKEVTVETNRRMLGFLTEDNKQLVADNITLENSKIIEPCFIGKNVELKNSIIGPHVSIGENTIIKNSIISNCIIQTNSLIRSTNIKNSMVGNHANIKGNVQELSVGDYNEIY